MKTSLSGAGAGEWVDLLASVASDDAVTSPLTGRRGAVVVVDVFERMPPSWPLGPSAAPTRGPRVEREVGRAILGDTIVLDADGGALVVVARRARFAFVSDGESGLLDRAPAELAFLLAAAKGSGALAWRERVVVRGARLHVRCVVTPSAAGRFTCDSAELSEPV